jgi:hypothetical protein
MTPILRVVLPHVVVPVEGSGSAFSPHSSRRAPTRVVEPDQFMVQGQGFGLQVARPHVVARAAL